MERVIGLHRARARPRAGRGAAAQLHPARRVPVGRRASRSRTAAPTRYDSGNYPAGLEMALEHDRRAATSARARPPRAPRAATSASASPATSRARASAPTRARTCASSRAARSSSPRASPRRGRGTRRRFAQIAADALGCDPADVTVVTGDTRALQLGRRHLREPRARDERQRHPRRRARGARQGAAARRAISSRSRRTTSSWRTGASRVKGAPGTAPHARRPRDGRQPDPLRLRQGGVGGRAAPRQAARGRRCSRPARSPGLEADGYYAPPQATFASGCHAAIVEVDVRHGRGRDPAATSSSTTAARW